MSTPTPVTVSRVVCHHLTQSRCSNQPALKRHNSQDSQTHTNPTTEHTCNKRCPRESSLFPITVVPSVGAQILDEILRSVPFILVRALFHAESHGCSTQEAASPDRMVQPRSSPLSLPLRRRVVAVTVTPGFPLLTSSLSLSIVDNTHSNYANGRRVGVIINVLRGSWVRRVLGESVDDSNCASLVFFHSPLAPFSGFQILTLMSSADVKDARKQSRLQCGPAKFKFGQRHNLLHEECMAATHTRRAAETVGCGILRSRREKYSVYINGELYISSCFFSPLVITCA